MKCKSFNELKVEKMLERLTPASKEELKALETMILADGEIHSPIIVWQGQNIVVDGHSRLAILKKHPKLNYTIKEIPFKDWQEAMVFIVEHHIARKSFTLWQKLEMAIQCETYWEAKAQAKANQGSRSDLKTPGDQKLKKINVNQIIADKVGCGITTVKQFKKVFAEPNEAIHQKCRESDMSIKRAYESLAPKNPPKKKPAPASPAETVVDMDSFDILQECENNIDVGNKNTSRTNGTPMNSSVIVEKIQQEKVPDGAIWIVLNKEQGQAQLVKKSYDKEKGTIHVKVNTFNFKFLSSDDGVVILEADHINGGTEELLRKDDSEFESKPKLAS